jgi:hypothetical protein
MGEDSLREGIYLQTKKSTIGTGSTAKATEFRNFWATLKVEESHVEMILLDDAFLLTGIREKFTKEELCGPNWLYVEQGEKKFSQLKPKLLNILNPQPKKVPPKSTASASPSLPNAFKSKTSESTKVQPKPSGVSAKKGSWWDK